MSERPPTSYLLHVSLNGLPAGGRDEVKECIETALATSVPDGSAQLIQVTECQQTTDCYWIEEHVTPFFALFCALPPELHCAQVYAALGEHYHREVSSLWRSVRDTRCVQAVIELRMWRHAGTQWICEFLSFDRSIPKGDEMNFHGQNTSQWKNPENGWMGHQGALVLDGETREITAHH